MKEDWTSRMQQAGTAGVASAGAAVAGVAAVARPVIPFKAAFLVALAAGLGYGFDAYAVNIFGIVGPLLAKDFAVTSKTIGLIGSIFLVGYTIGTIGFGILADRIGRRPALGISILLYGITTSLGGATANLPLFSFLRFLTGIGGAGELAVGAPYTAEMWPKHIRAVGTGGVMFSLYSLGYICAAAAALMIVPHWGWRWAFGFALVPAILVFLFRQFILESERYKLAQAELNRLSLDAKKEARPNIWTIPGAKRRIVVGWLLYTANACGYWGITVFLTTFMVKKFGVAPTTAIFYALCFYIVQFFLSYVGTWLSDATRSRKLAGILGAVIMIACTVMAATSTTLNGFLIYGAVMIGMLGWLWGVGDTYLSEFFRTTLRGTGFGIMVGGGRVMSIVAPFLVGWGIAAWGPTIPFLLTAGLWVLTIIGYLLGPETAGRELEEVQL